MITINKIASTFYNNDSDGNVLPGFLKSSLTRQKLAFEALAKASLYQGEKAMK